MRNGLSQANHYGMLFGGTALSLMGKAAFIAASHHARAAVVMARSEQIAFHHPVSVGQLVELHAYVTRDGRSSMTVYPSRAHALTGRRWSCSRGRRTSRACGGALLHLGCISARPRLCRG